MSLCAVFSLFVVDSTPSNARSRSRLLRNTSYSSIGWIISGPAFQFQASSYEGLSTVDTAGSAWTVIAGVDSLRVGRSKVRVAEIMGESGVVQRGAWTPVSAFPCEHLMRDSCLTWTSQPKRSYYSPFRDNLASGFPIRHISLSSSIAGMLSTGLFEDLSASLYSLCQVDRGFGTWVLSVLCAKVWALLPSSTVAYGTLYAPQYAWRLLGLSMWSSIRGGKRIVHRTARRILDAHPPWVRVFCDCPSCIAFPPAPGVFRAKSIDFRQNWLGQVLTCSSFPGYEPVPVTAFPTFGQFIKEQFNQMLAELVSGGRFLLVDKPKPVEEAQPLVEDEQLPPIAVVVVIWMETSGESGYSDLVLITGDDRCIRLDDHSQQLRDRGVEPDVELEVYDPLSEVWSSLTRPHVLGPFDGVGGTVLLRQKGVTELRNFSAFLPLARSLKKGKGRAL
ncbi:hypothetical protein NMY22_g3319 [Coprinellus aureogranulatus]|nr:hypothetical protein NMY22_g3319 [Coprinellus aureogranulatus]